MALARNQQMARAIGYRRASRSTKSDALVATTGGTAWLIDWERDSSFANSSAQSRQVVRGLPHITVPAGNETRECH